MAQRILVADGERERESISVVAHCLYDRKDALCRRITAVLGMELRENFFPRALMKRILCGFVNHNLIEFLQYP